MSEETLFAYDKVLYPNYLHTQTHPDRLATMTKFFGMNPKPIERCRVLELGCGSGGSLLSFALDLSESEFIGIDLSEKQIEKGKEIAREVGLPNLTLLQGDILEVSREKFGEFDYIIAHGLYSWVPETVRDQILKICRECLTKQGVAFVSYNAMPGSHLRQMAREMMLFHTRNLTSPTEKVNQSLALLKFIIDSASRKEDYQKILQFEFKKMQERNYQGVFHDDLAEVNHPMYFYEFAAHATNFDLQFVTEVEHFTIAGVNYPKEVLETLEEISEDGIAFEQYLDFIDCRRFRQSLLCHKEINLRPQPDLKILRALRIASRLRPASERIELASDKHETFLNEKNKKIEIGHPLTKAAFIYLGKIWMRTTTFENLVSESRKLIAEENGEDFEVTEKDKEILTEILFRIFCTGMLRLHTREPVYATEVSEKPMASPLARWQSQDEDLISTLLCTHVAMQDKLGRELIRLLDGTRSRRQLIADLTEFINSKKFEQSAEVKEKILRDLPQQLETNLKDFARMALLIS